MLGKPALVKIVRDEIAKRGPMPFVRFMELALYHPQYGYYTDPNRAQIGRSGDFYTSVSVGALFGQLLAQQFEQMWEILGQPRPFHILEQGAHEGRLAIDVLLWLKQCRPALFSETVYHFVEPSPTLRARQEIRIAEASLSGQVHWTPSPAVETGLWFSNELVDSFPVHRVCHREGHWHESHVVWENESFGWRDLPITNSELAKAVEQLPLPAIEGYATEINLAARTWMSKIAGAVQRGFFLTIDYGYLEEAYYHPQRSAGTLTGYHHHQRVKNLLENVGQQDLTAHVDFSSLMRVGADGGLTTLGWTDQHHFLIGLAHDDLSNFEERGLDQDPHFRETARAFRTLMHPEIMGTSFKYLVQSKGLTDCPTLNGLKFAKRGNF